MRTTIRSRELGRRLRAAQAAAGLHGRELAKALGWSESAVSRTVNGVRQPADTDVAAFLTVCRVFGAERDQILRLAKSGDDQASELHLPADEHWPALVAHARSASHLTIYEPLIVPWPAQVPAYSRELIAHSPDILASELDARVTERRTAVELIRLPAVTLLVHEQVLHAPIGSAAVMSDQLHHLLTLSVRPTVSLHIVPAINGSHAWGHGAFTLLEFPGAATVLYREQPHTGVFTHDPATIAHHMEITRRLNQLALNPRATSKSCFSMSGSVRRVG